MRHGHTTLLLVCFRPVWAPVPPLPLFSHKALVQPLPDPFEPPLGLSVSPVLGNRVTGRGLRVRAQLVVL